METFLPMCDGPMLMLCDLIMYLMGPFGYVPYGVMLLLGFTYLEINFYLRIRVSFSPSAPS